MEDYLNQGTYQLDEAQFREHYLKPVASIRRTISYRFIRPSWIQRKRRIQKGPGDGHYDCHSLSKKYKREPIGSLNFMLSNHLFLQYCSVHLLCFVSQITQSNLHQIIFIASIAFSLHELVETTSSQHTSGTVHAKGHDLQSANPTADISLL